MQVLDGSSPYGLSSGDGVTDEDGFRRPGPAASSPLGAPTAGGLY